MAEPAREPDYATKADLDVLRAEVRSDLDVAVERLENRLRAEIAAGEARMLWRLLGGMAALLTLFRLLELLPVG